MTTTRNLSEVVKLEVHEHVFVRGPRSGQHIHHAHEGGAEPHQHDATGPSCYTIDKDEWYRRTGLRGGGRKVFSDGQKGVQLAIVPLEEWQRDFDVIVTPSAVTGPGTGAAARMELAFGMRARPRRAS